MLGCRTPEIRAWSYRAKDACLGSEQLGYAADDDLVMVEVVKSAGVAEFLSRYVGEHVERDVLYSAPEDGPLARHLRGSSRGRETR